MEKNQSKLKYLKIFGLLHVSLFFSSLGTVASKMAANQKLMSPTFLFYYGLVLFIMFGYALLWQQILKRIPLTVAYANKPVTLVWGMLLGKILFGEVITWTMILGAAVIFIGVYLVVTSNE